MWVRFLGQEDPLEEGIATTPVFLPGESHGQVDGQQSMVTKSQTWLKNLARVPWYGFAFVYTDLSVLHFVLLGRWGARGVLLVPVFFYSCLTILVLYKFVLLSMWPILFFHRPIFLFLLHFVSVLEFVYFYIDQSLSSKILYFPFSPEFLLSDITALECPLCCFWRQKKNFWQCS